MRSRLSPHAWTLLITLGAVVLLNGALTTGLIAFGAPPAQALNQTAPGRSDALLRSAGNDSWKPMARAQRAFNDKADESLYRVFFEDHIKFQYPPSALFVLDLFPSRRFDGPDSPLLLASYLMVANALLRPAWLLADPVREVLASHLFFGALLLFAILVTMRARPQPSPTPH